MGSVQTLSGEVFGWGRGWEEGVMWGELPMEEFLMGEEKSHEGGAGFFSIFWEEQWKNKYEKVFQL